VVIILPSDLKTAIVGAVKEELGFPDKFHTSASGGFRLTASMPFGPRVVAMFGSVGEKSTNDLSLIVEVTAPVTVFQNTTLPLL
jgi:hypothetical protein